MMRRAIGVLLAGTLLISACQVQMKELAPKKPTTAAAKRDPKPSASPAPQASASASATPVSSASPAAPQEPQALLKGLVQIDAAYVISTGGGNVISTGGGNVISTGGGNVISTGGGNVISTGGGNVISVGGGNVISTGGGNVISTGGGNVISTGGGNVISTGGGNYRLLELAGVAAGTILPVKGMVVVPVSLLDDRQVGPAVFSNDKGEFELSIPEYLQGKVRLYAAVPGKDAQDPLLANSRTWYNVLPTGAKGESVAIDEDTVKVTRLLRDTFKTKFVYYMDPANYTNGDKDDLLAGNVDIKFEEDVPEFQKIAIVTAIKQLLTLQKKYNIPETRAPELARRMADIMIANVKDLSQIQITKATSAGWTGADTPALPYMVTIMKELRLRAQEKLDAGAIKPDYPTTLKADIDQTNAIIAVDIEEDKAWNLAHPEDPKTLATLRPYLKNPNFRIERASDLTEFMVDEFFTSSTVAFKNAHFVLQDLLRSGEDVKVADDYMIRMDAAAKAVAFVFGIEFLKFQNATYSDTDPEVKLRPELKGKNKMDALFEEFSRQPGS